MASQTNNPITVDGQEEVENMVAPSKVFDTAELLEIILLNCPQQSIILLRRVARNWSATIKGSQKLQKTLFARSIGFYKLRQARLPRRTHIYPYERALRIDDLTTPIWKYEPDIHYVMNPFLFKVFAYAKEGDLEFLKYDIKVASAIYNIESNVAASWKQTLLTQSPTKHAVIKLDVNHWTAENAAKKSMPEAGLQPASWKRTEDLMAWERTMNRAANREVARGGYDDSPCELINETWVTMGEVAAALPGMLAGASKTMEIVTGKVGMALFTIRI